jgi:tRNA A37 threonylcarbamoyladenosine biosynthesis protein TsaE
MAHRLDTGYSVKLKNKKRSMAPCGTLYYLCGKMGAGKSTLSRQLALDHQALVLSEDD